MWKHQSHGIEGEQQCAIPLHTAHAAKWNCPQFFILLSPQRLKYRHLVRNDWFHYHHHHHLLLLLLLLLLLIHGGLAGFKRVQVTDQALLTHYSSKILLLLLLLLLLCTIELFFLPKGHGIEMFLSRRTVLNMNMTVNMYFQFNLGTFTNCKSENELWCC